ncbi:hypothetical protein, partial [Nostoc sp.]|uniref:hypothetical protein n=1 Tax=Nostoc sp. TaxID=1180 RepID=UPI002FEFD716
SVFSCFLFACNLREQNILYSTIYFLLTEQYWDTRGVERSMTTGIASSSTSNAPFPMPNGECGRARGARVSSGGIGGRSDRFGN